LIKLSSSYTHTTQSAKIKVNKKIKKITWKKLRQKYITVECTSQSSNNNTVY